MTTLLMKAPPGITGSVYAGPSFQYQVAADGTISADQSVVPILMKAGFTFCFAEVGHLYVVAPIAAELVSVVAAATPVSGTAMTLATQPAVPRKLQVRGVYSGAVAGLVVNIVGVNGQGVTVSETVNVAAASSTTFPTVNAYAKVTSVTPVGSVTNVTTIGVGVGAALALPLPPIFTDLVVFKEAATQVDETVGTVDTVAGTVSPTTAPDATHNFDFWFAYNRASQ